MKFPKFPTNFSAFKNSLKKIEIAALVIFIIFLLFPFKIPADLAKLINSAAGFLLIFVVILLLFVNAHPVVAILFLLVAYELLRRSGKVSNGPLKNVSSDKEAPSCSSELHLNPVNGTAELNDTDKDFNANYENPVPYVLLPYEQNYASLGVDSNEAAREQELARMNPPAQVQDSLEVSIIQQRVSGDNLHANVVAESSDYSPVYDKIAFEVSDV